MLAEFGQAPARSKLKILQNERALVRSRILGGSGPGTSQHQGRNQQRNVSGHHYSFAASAEATGRQPVILTTRIAGPSLTHSRNTVKAKKQR
jgi:hypothetical protein